MVEDASDIDAVTVVANVIADGIVSNNNTHYCYISKFCNDAAITSQLLTEHQIFGEQDNA